MQAGKNIFVRFAKIAVPPIITMAGKMPNHKFGLEPSVSLDPQQAWEEDNWITGEPSQPFEDAMQEYGDNSDFEASAGWASVMPKLQVKFAQYEREDRETGAIRSFIGNRLDFQEDDNVYPAAGACSGFGFKKGDSFYVNEGLRCGNRGKQSRASLLVYLGLHYCDLDSKGFCQYGNTREIAKMAGLTVRTVRNSLRKLAAADYIQVGGIDRDGDFAFHVPDYQYIGLTYLEGGRGYLNLEEGMLRQLASMRDVNALRMALRMLVTVDNPRSAGEAVVRGRSLRFSLPKYVTWEMFRKSVDRIRNACPFLDIGESNGKGRFTVRLPEEQDAKARRAQADLENQKKLEEYIPQLSSLYGKKYDEAEDYHHKCGKYPPQFNVFGYENERLDRELIFKADQEQTVQYASMATQYGLGIVKQALRWLAREVSVFREWIDCQPAYLRQIIRRHPDGVFASCGAC